MNRRFGNAQTIGNNVNQNTYFMTKQIGDGFLAVLADGTIDSVTGAYGAILTCESIAKGIVSPENISARMEEQFKRAAALLHERLYRGRQPRVSVLAACFVGKMMIYRNVGELSVMNFSGRELTEIKADQGELERKGGLILLSSQGVWQALSEIEVEKILSGRGHPYRKAQHMIEAVNCRNIRDQKSALAVIVA